jgi:hypothetical protein
MAMCTASPSAHTATSWRPSARTAAVMASWSCGAPMVGRRPAEGRSCTGMGPVRVPMARYSGCTFSYALWPRKAFITSRCAMV